MNIEDYRHYCLNKPGVTEGFPFDETTLVFKVMNKMFALMDVDGFDGINLKCQPDHAVELREKYDGIQPGYHMNKQHWNTVSTDGSVPDDLILELTDLSYNLIVEGLTKKARKELEQISAS